ncbi:hypothetical protein MJO47_02950 [Desulfuromonas sp. KJ2020]|uniref:hypothetical protein n=1 Tax=Desulfuromonas sp. KJ2020 TaxID=2919173 RepID=UPI0020A7C1C0|nr:hypothetical protein [Desulfuromonas sp. KJ2020]MCP3176050.1 hypothetical protein [Desulfuromonas sp. KJ2020]
MFKARWVTLLATLFVGTLAMSGCGSSGGGGGGGGATVTGGVVVDPYIVGASFFEDANGNGRWDEGEQISSSSDENGQFTFATTIPAGRTIILYEPGSHQGIPYTGMLARTIRATDVDTVVVSPLTTLVALGLSETEIVDYLTDVTDNGTVAPLGVALTGIPTFSEEHIFADPYTGLNQLTAENVTDADIACLRANVYAGALMEFYLAERLGSTLTEAEARGLFSGAWFGANLLTSAVEAVYYATAPSAMARITAALPTGYDFPAVTMRDVADTIPAIFTWWKQEAIRQYIEDEDSYFDLGAFTVQVNAVQGGELGLNYFAMNNAQNGAVIQAVTDGAFPLTNDIGHLYLREDGSVGSTGELAFADGLLSGKAFYLGSLFRFAADGNLELIGPVDDSGLAETQTIPWSITAGVLDLEYTGLPFDMTLVADWSSHIYARAWGELMDGLSGATALPLVKIREQDSGTLSGAQFIVDDGICTNNLCGGWLDLSSETTGTLRYYPDGTASSFITWGTDTYGGLAVTHDDGTTDTVYFLNDKGAVVSLTDADNDEVADEYDDDTEFNRPLLFSETALDNIRLTFSGSYIINENEEFETLELWDNNDFMLSHPLDGNVFGAWAYDEATGQLTLTPSGATNEEFRIWFIENYDDDGADMLRFFYEEDDENGELIESGFERVERTIAIPPY